MGSNKSGSQSAHISKNLIKKIEKAGELSSQGKLDKAISLCESLCQRYGNKYSEPWIALAAIHKKCGRNQQALSCLQTGAKTSSESAKLYAQMAILYQEGGDLSAARSHYVKSLQIDSNQPLVQYNLGVIYMQENNFQKAENCFHQTVALDSNHAAAHANLAYALRMQRKFDFALTHYNHALILLPDNLDILFNYAITLEDSGKLSEAVESYRRVLEIEPKHDQAMNAIGVALTNQGRHIEARKIIQQAISLCPDKAIYHSNLGLILSRQGDIEKAMEKLEMSLKLDPDDAACHFNYALSLLLLGDFERGWKEYEWRWGVHSRQQRVTSKPLIKSSNLEGKTVYIHAEQGLGDSIQFIRYLQLIKNKGAYVIFESQPELIHLFSIYPYIDKLIKKGDAIPDFDFQAPLLNLPGIFGSDINSIPSEVPYLYPPAKSTTGIDALLPGSSNAYRVGIVWAGSPNCLHDQIRSCVSTLFSEFKDVPHVELYSLQKGTPSADLKQLQDLCPVIDLAPILKDFSNTATAVSRLDLVITVDTAMAHLAGAMGWPVWLILNTAVEWRWLLQREDSPWYPTMRLFRQQQPDDWNAVFKQMRKTLVSLLQEGKTGH